MYTEKEVEALKAYPSKTVDELALQLGKSNRSIIAKLSKMGLYRKEKLNKVGQPIMPKLEMVAEIENALGISCPTLVKCGKDDLRLIMQTLCE